MDGKVLGAFQAHGCADCKDAITRLDNISKNNSDVDALFNDVFRSTTIVVDLDPDSQNGFLKGAITISHTPLATGAHDKSLGDRMADSTVFESLNASLAAQYLLKDQAFDLSGDVKTAGARTAELEVGIMATFIELAEQTPAEFRTGNMERALLRSAEAKSASTTLKEYLLNAPHEAGAMADDYMGLPTRQLYIYEAIVKSTPDQIKQIVLKRIGQPYHMEKTQKGPKVTITSFKTDTGAALPADVTKLLDLLKSWPGAGRQTSRPRFFLTFLEKVQNDAALARFRAQINSAQFGFDNASIVAMAQRQPA